MFSRHRDPQEIERREKGWDFIKKRLDLLLANSGEGVSIEMYSEVYHAVFELESPPPIHTGQFSGEYTYRKLEHYLRTHCKGILTEIQAEHGDEFSPDALHLVLNRWENYQKCCKIITRMFSYVQRHWVKCEADRAEVHDLDILCLLLWKQELFPYFRNNPRDMEREPEPFHDLRPRVLDQEAKRVREGGQALSCAELRMLVDQEKENVHRQAEKARGEEVVDAMKSLANVKGMQSLTVAETMQS